MIAFRWCQFACVSLTQWGVHVSKSPSKVMSNDILSPSAFPIFLKLSDSYFVFCMNGRSTVRLKKGKYLNSRLSEIWKRAYSSEIPELFYWWMSCWSCWYTWFIDKLQNVSLTEMHPIGLDIKWWFFFFYITWCNLNLILNFRTFQSSSWAQCLCLFEIIWDRVCPCSLMKLLCQKYYFWCHAWDVTWS